MEINIFPCYRIILNYILPKFTSYQVAIYITVIKNILSENAKKTMNKLREERLTISLKFNEMESKKNVFQRHSPLFI